MECILQIKFNSSKTSKYGKQKSPQEIKVDEHFERRRATWQINHARPMESNREKAAVELIVDKKENDLRQIGKIREKQRGR